MPNRYAPTTTYRLQFSSHFTFADAERLVPYLTRLGVTDCYMSPVLRAAAGSSHGYDICDHASLNPELGSDRDFDSLAAALRDSGIGLILDFVPNHMGLDPSANLWWRDVLQHGQASPYSDFFDIDWDPLTPELKGRILLPILQDGYGEVLERGELKLVFEGGEFQLRFYDRRLPIEPGSTIAVLKSALPSEFATGSESPADAGGPEARDWHDFAGVVTLLDELPPTTACDPDEQRLRQDITRSARECLTALVERSPHLRTAIAQAVERINGTPGQPATFDRLHDLLDRQPYRIAHWKTAFDEINYRRFFDINDLGAIRMEDSRVFHAAHARILQLIAEGKVTGLRIDHPDGLLDPARYFERLEAATAEALSRGGHQTGVRFFVVAEKILSTGEVLPARWPVAGTTGYGFLNAVNGLFVDSDNADLLRKGYVRVTGRRETFEEAAYHAQRLVMGSSMASELRVLTHALKWIALGDRRTRDYTVNALSRTIADVVACLPCYRTYINSEGFTSSDREMTDVAVDRARRMNPVMVQSLFMFLRNVLLAEGSEGNGKLPSFRQFAMKFQQFSAPIQAKGIEDTSFYRYNVLVSLNEVGGDPAKFGTSPDEFHGGNQTRLERWPRELNTTATHDTKRGEDARARLNVLSEIPQLWRHGVSEWRKINAVHRTAVDRAWAPDANDEYLFYQTLVSTWPPERLDAPLPAEAPAELVARVSAYMQKAIKEAKTHTSWFNQGGPYEDAVERFVDTTLHGSAARRFLKSFVPFVRRVSACGMVNSLAQVVVKVASPGVPDFYQGTEFWQLDLADPDNRRPVDFGSRAVALEAVMPWIEQTERPSHAAASCGELEAFVRDLLASWQDGRIKLFLTACALRLRRHEPALFIEGRYEPLRAEGAEASHLMAFSRTLEDKSLIAAVPRLMNRDLPATHRLPVGMEVWKDTRLLMPPNLAQSSFRNLFTGSRLKPDDGGGLVAAELFRTLPVAVLIVEA